MEPPRVSAYISIESRITVSDLHFAADIGLFSLKFFMAGTVKLFYFCKNDVSAVQGHPRSLIFVPIESAYATSY